MELISSFGPSAIPWIICAVVAAVLGYYLTDAVKPLVLFLSKHDRAEDPVWWQVTFRVTPLVIGGLVGILMLGVSDFWVGILGGAFSTQIYRKIDKQIENFRLDRKFITSVAEEVRAQESVPGAEPPTEPVDDDQISGP